jgi:hypothetical protein
MNPVMPPAPSRLSRRALLRALTLASGAVVLAGCDDLSADREVSPTGGVVPDDPATWPPDTSLLVAARQRVHGYRRGLELLGRAGRAEAAGLEELWRVQQERLELLITLGGVTLPHLLDEPAVTWTGAPDGAGATGAPTSGRDGEQGTGDAGGATAASEARTGRPAAADLGRAIRSDRTQAVRELSTASSANLLLLASLCAQHVASAARLGAPVGWDPLAGPLGAAAVPVLAAARPAVFGLEVLAARSAPDSPERADYEAVLRPLRGVTRQLSTLAGHAAPVAPLGYDLPEPLETAAQRRDLARRLVADLAPATLDAAQRVPGDLAQLTGVVQLVSESALWSDLLGGPAQPFPGMTLP